MILKKNTNELKVIGELNVPWVAQHRIGGIPAVTEQLTEALATSANINNRIHDAMVLAESFMVLERCLDSLPTGTFKSMVEGFVEQLRKRLEE